MFFISACCLGGPLYFVLARPDVFVSAPIWANLFMAGLALLGVGLVPLFLTRKKRDLARTAYGLSNQRAMIAKLGTANPVKDFPIKEWNDVKLSPKPKNLYILRFASEVSGCGKYRVVLEHGFEFIEDGPTVHQIMLNLKPQ